MSSFESVAARNRNLDYVNVREHQVRHSATRSSCIESSAAAQIDIEKMRLRTENNLTRYYSYQSDSDVQRADDNTEEVRAQIAQMDPLPEKYEINHTQQYVKELLKCASKLVKSTPNSYKWKGNVEMPRNVVGQKKDVEDFPMMSRIYCPYTNQPDFVLSYIGFDKVVGPLVEVKKESDLSKQLDKYTRQAGLYGIGFMQRVFPMLPSQDVSSIFGEEWYVYVPLMSHKSLYILRIDLCDIYRSGRIIIARSVRLQGAEMARWLTVWITWAIGVYDQLLERVTQLNQPVAQYCWIPPHLLSRKFSQVNPSKLVARPSFYNPIYIEKVDDKDSGDDKKKGYVYKLYSIWTANLVPVKNKILSDSSLCQGWVFDGAVLKMPYYHRGDLYQNPPHDFKKLVDVVLQVLNILMHLQEKHQLCHCDIRAPNICWYSENLVTLIDYDLACEIGNSSPKDKEARDKAPDEKVYVNHDLWLLGAMVLQLTSDYFTWGVITEHRDVLVPPQDDLDWEMAPAEPQFHPFDFTSIEWKETFVPYVNQLQLIIEKCLQLHNFRWQLVELKTHLESLMENI